MKILYLLLCLITLWNPILLGQTEKEQKKAVKISKKATKQFDKDHFQKAISLYSSSITYDSLNAFSYFSRGKAYAAITEHKKAIQDYDAAIALNHKESDYYWARGSSHIALAHYIDAVADFEKGATMIEKLSVSQRKMMIEGYLYTYQIGEALPYIDQLIAEYPAESIYYVQRATCNLALGELKEMHSDLRKLEELEDTSHDRYKLETLFHMSTKNADLAIQSARKNIRTTDAPSVKAEAYQLLSNVYYSIDYRDSAMNAINLAIRFDPQAVYYYDRACYYADEGKLELAFDDFNRTIDLDSTHIGAYNNRTFFIWFPQKQFENAVSDLSKIIALDSLNAYAYSNRSYAYYGLKKYELAFHDALKSFDLESKNPYLYKNMALIYFALGDETEAKAMVQNALDWGFHAQTDPEFLTLLDYFKIPPP